MSTIRVGKGFRRKGLTEAIATLSKAGDTILLDPGVYQVPNGFTISALTLKGVGEPGSVILDTFFDVSGEATLSNMTVRAPAFKTTLIVRKGSVVQLNDVDVISEPTGKTVGVWVTGGALDAASCILRRADASRSEDTMLCVLKAESAARIQLSETSCPESQIWAGGASNVELSHVSAGQLWVEGGSRVSSRDIVSLGNRLRQRQIVVSGQSTCELVRLHTTDGQAEAYCENGFLRLALHTNGDPMDRASLPVYVKGQSAVAAPPETAHVVDQARPQPHRPKTVDWPAGADWDAVAQNLMVGDTLVLDEGEHTIPERTRLRFDILGKGRPDKVLLHTAGLWAEGQDARSVSNLTVQGDPEHNAVAVLDGGELTMSSVTVRNGADRVYTVSVDGGRLGPELADILAEINNRPRKVLGWQTPAEVFEQLCSSPPASCCTSN